ncbi:MAG: RluA family pseudouridine synthase [Clostridiales bacterium]|jgi:23S rRNA pseudouridine1911/1915/1917 synthase|nr:RluA family pseudouridine synthase [Clostridiales bacterium]
MTAERHVCGTKIIAYNGCDERLDRVCAQYFDISRSSAQILIDDGSILLNDKAAAKSARPKPGDIITLNSRESIPLNVTPESIPLDILYEDDDLIVINKPKGMVVHPAPGHYNGTLVNALLYHCKGGLSGINGVMRPGILHRIDKDTSGVLVAAKTDAAHNSLANQIAAHTANRIYHAIAHGVLHQDITIDKPIGRSTADRKKMAVTLSGRRAITHVRVLAQFAKRTHIECRLETGRTHQIRVHLASINHPLLGDGVYGRPDGIDGGQVLHAKALSFTHPVTGQRLTFDTNLPDGFRFILKNS